MEVLGGCRLVEGWCGGMVWSRGMQQWSGVGGGGGDHWSGVGACSIGVK